MGQKVDLGAQDQVQQAARRAQEDLDHTADDHDGDEVGRIEDGLDHPLELVKPHLVDNEGQDDGDREAPQQSVEADEHRILHHPPEGGGLEEPDEPVEAYPGAPGEAQIGIKVPEGDLDAVHRDVLVDNCQRHGNQQQGVELPVVQESLSQRLAVSLGQGGGARRRDPDRRFAFSHLTHFLKTRSLLHGRREFIEENFLSQEPRRPRFPYNVSRTLLKFSSRSSCRNP